MKASKNCGQKRGFVKAFGEGIQIPLNKLEIENS